MFMSFLTVITWHEVWWRSHRVHSCDDSADMKHVDRVPVYSGLTCLAFGARSHSSPLPPESSPHSTLQIYSMVYALGHMSMVFAPIQKPYRDAAKGMSHELHHSRLERYSSVTAPPSRPRYTFKLRQFWQETEFDGPRS